MIDRSGPSRNTDRGVRTDRESCGKGKSRLQGALTGAERSVLDPKGGDLHLTRVKPDESLVEAHPGADVQIARSS